MPKSIDSLPPDVVEAWRGGRKIEAIKLLREATGAGLVETRAALEALGRAEEVRQHSRTDAAIAKSQGAMVDGAKGGGAKVANRALAPGTLGPGLGPGEMPRAKSEPWLFVVLAIALLAIWAWSKLT